MFNLTELKHLRCGTQQKLLRWFGIICSVLVFFAALDGHNWSAVPLTVSLTLAVP